MMPRKAPKVAHSRSITHAHEELARRFKQLSEEFAMMCPERTLLITCVYRSPEEQRRLYKRGRFGSKEKIVTNCDGKDKKSNHNHFPSRAIDVCVLISGKPSWDEMYYYPLGPLSTKHGLKWGGYWEKFQDYPHLELPDDVD